MCLLKRAVFFYRAKTRVFQDTNGQGAVECAAALVSLGGSFGSDPACTYIPTLTLDNLTALLAIDCHTRPADT